MSDMFYEDDLAAHKALVAAIKSWKVEVIADDSRKWVGNALRFATKGEADGYGANLYVRWTHVREYHSVASTDAVNASWKDGRLGDA